MGRFCCGSSDAQPLPFGGVTQKVIRSGTGKRNRLSHPGIVSNRKPLSRLRRAR